MTRASWLESPINTSVRHLTYDYRARSYSRIYPADAIVRRSGDSWVTALGERWPTSQTVWLEGTIVLGSEHGSTREVLVPADHPAATGAFSDAETEKITPHE